MTTPAEELFQAAQRIRARIARTMPGPWTYDVDSRAVRSPHGSAASGLDPYEGKHIALFDPIVAEAMAFMLVHFADTFEDVPAVLEEQTRSEQAVLSLARAINEGGGR